MKLFSSLNLSTKIFFLIVILGIIWEILFFYFFPKQVWGDGLLEAWWTSKGLIMYKDFPNQYFPILFIFMTLLHMVLGFNQMVTIIITPINSIFLLILLAIVSFKWLKGWFRLMPVLFFLLWDGYLGENHFSTTSYQNTINFLVFISWWSWFKNPRRITAFCLGIFLGLTAMSSQIVAFFIGLIFLSIIFKILKNKKYLSSLILAGFAFLIPVAIVLGWVSKMGALFDMYYWTFQYYFSGYLYASGREFKNLLAFFAVFSPILIVFIILFRSKGKNELSRYIFWLLILLSLPVPFFFAIFHPNRFLIGLSIFAISLGLGMQKLFEIRHKPRFIVGAIIGIIILLNLVTFYKVILPKYKWGFSYPRQYNVLTKVYPNDPMFEVIDWIKNNTPKNARLFATTDSMIYFETNRLPVNLNATSNLPVAYEPFDQFIPRLKARSPDYWVIDERNWKRFHDFGYDHATKLLQRILSCEPIVAQIEYVTVRKHEQGKDLCI